MNPRLHAELHDHRPDHVDHYEQSMKKMMLALSYVDKPFPELLEYRNGHFLSWDMYRRSIWTDTASDLLLRNETTWSFINKEKKSCLMEPNHFPAWVEPPEDDDMPHSDQIWVLPDGNYVVYQSYAEGSYGHFAHDWFPTLAWLRATLPADVKFILRRSPNIGKELRFIDSDFLERRVVWIIDGRVIHVRNNSTLIVPHLDGSPEVMGHKLLNYARAWIQENHPSLSSQSLSMSQHPTKNYHQPFQDNQTTTTTTTSTTTTSANTSASIAIAPRSVIFYSRLNAPNMRGGRTMDPDQQIKAIEIIKEKMAKYKPNEKLVIFNGWNHNRSMSVEEQFHIFRQASTIIGPHGTGISGNIIWTGEWLNILPDG